MSDPVRHGFYSAKAVAEGCGTYFWATPDGGEVEITGVEKDLEGSAYKWADKVYVGPVTRGVRKGIASTLPGRKS